MFNFGSDEYRWCCECSGNVRVDAYYCRYCHKAIGNRLLKNKPANNGFLQITKAVCWIPRWDDTVLSVPGPFRDRIAEEDEKAPVSVVGLKPELTVVEARRLERNPDKCSPDRPENQVLGLIWDILLSLHGASFPVSSLCSEPRLQLLQISSDAISAEADLRRQEIEGRLRCDYCSEFVLSPPSQTPCRFCSGSDSPPEAVNLLAAEFYEQYDESLLKAILSWEAAKRRLEGEDPLAAEQLARHGITEEQIDRQVLALRHNPSHLPRSAWRERMFQLGIDFGYPDIYDQPAISPAYCLITDIVSLGRSLAPGMFRAHQAHTNVEDALVVFNHVLNRWQKSPYYAQEVPHLLDAKSMLYIDQDTEKYEDLKTLADFERNKSLSEDARKMISSLKSTEDFSALKGLRSDDPDERLKALDQFAEQHLERCSMLENATDTLGALGGAFKGLNETTMRMMQLSKKLLQAQSANKKGDHRAAAELYEQALIDVESIEHSVQNKSIILAYLAETQVKLGEMTLAETTFRQAICEARDEAELGFGIDCLPDVHHRFFLYLFEQNRLEEARQNLDAAMTARVNANKRSISNGYLEPQDQNLGLTILKTDYLKLLGVLGLAEQCSESSN